MRWSFAPLLRTCRSVFLAHCGVLLIAFCRAGFLDRRDRRLTVIDFCKLGTIGARCVFVLRLGPQWRGMRLMARRQFRRPGMCLDTAPAAIEADARAVGVADNRAAVDVVIQRDIYAIN
jgi:hypothetical protein